jgi:hypothetical protein
MNYNQYNSLHQKQQLETLWTNGFAINARIDADYSYTLYRLNLFFVELKYFKKIFDGLTLFKNIKECKNYKKNKHPTIMA